MRSAEDDRIAIWLDRVEEVAPVARAWADWSEQHARPAPELVDALKSSGLLGLLTAKELGGADLSPWVIGPMIEALARVDGSAGWTLALSQTGLARPLPSASQAEMFGSGDASVAGSLNPIHTRAEQVEGGYRFTGRGTNVSGCTHADWMLAAAIVVDDGVMRRIDDAVVIVAGWMPMSRCQVEDTWKVMGMRGTGSHDVTFEDVVVPDHMTMPLGDALANLGASLAPVALGIGRHALDAFVELAATKVPGATRSLLRDRVTAQAQLGQAEGLLQAGRSLFYETAREADELRSAETPPSPEQRARLRLGSVMAAQLSAQAVDLIFDAAGLTAASQTCPIERCWRDVHTVRQHITLATSRFEVVGRVRLGLDPGSPVI